MFHIHSVATAVSSSSHVGTPDRDGSRATIDRILTEGSDPSKSYGMVKQSQTSQSLSRSEKWTPELDDVAPTRRQRNASPSILRRLQSHDSAEVRDSSMSLVVLNDRLFSKLAHTAFFRHGITVVIILGAIQMGLEADFNHSGWRLIWTVWDNFYTGICTAEMIVMMEVYRREYFTTFWMLSDFALAIASILDVWIFPAVGAGGVGFLRILRLFRILRVVKITKVIPELSVVVEGLLASIRSMFWIFLLLFVILYAGGILCVNLLGQADAGYPAYNAEPAAVKHELVGKFNAFIYFGTLFRSMNTLLGMMLLAEWQLVRQVAQVHFIMVPVFLCMLVIVTFGTMNVIIGVVVEKTTKAMNQPRLDEVERQKGEKMALASTLADMIYSIDTDGDGRISVSELESALGNEKFNAILRGLELPSGFTVVEFLSMLDVDGSGSLSRHEFVTGLYRLIFCTGWQRDCINAMTLGMLHHSMLKKNEDVLAEVKKCHDALRAEIQTAVHLIVARSHPSKQHSGVSSCSELEFSRSGVRRPTNPPSITFRSTSNMHASVWEPVPENEVVSIVHSSRDSGPRPQVLSASSADPSANKNERLLSSIPSADRRTQELDEESWKREVSGGYVVTPVSERETHGDGGRVGDEDSWETGQDGNDENTSPRNLRRNYLL